MVLELGVGGAHDGVGVAARLQQQHRVHAFLGALGHADDRRLAHAGEVLSTRSTSSGKTFSPSGVTIISFLRPLMKTRPSASRSPMSPVCSQPSASTARLEPARRARRPSDAK